MGIVYCHFLFWFLSSQCLVDAARQSCSTSPVELKLGEAGVTLSSHQADTSGCGLPRAPWTIKTSQGQRVNITLVDFGWEEVGIQNSHGNLYGYVVERSLGMNTTFCGGGNKESHVYLSASSEVEISVVPRDRRQTSSAFLLVATSNLYNKSKAKEFFSLFKYFNGFYMFWYAAASHSILKPWL